MYIHLISNCNWIEESNWFEKGLKHFAVYNIINTIMLCEHLHLLTHIDLMKIIYIWII